MAYLLQKYISKKTLANFCREHLIRKLSLFGSVLEGTENSDSDIDLLVEFKEEHVPGLFDLSRMEITLTDLFKRKADLRTSEELSRFFRDEVIRSAEVQFEE